MRGQKSERENLALRTSELWQPLSLVPPDNARARVVSLLRRYFDLQSGSIWRDLRPVLAEAQGTVVDVGCGAQPYRSLLPSSVNYIGLDTADSQDHFGYSVPDVRIIGADGSWPVEDLGADMVLATETLEHVPDPDAFLAEAARVLRPGGRLVLSVPFAARWHYIPYDYWRYTPSSLRVLLERAGFADVVVNGRGNELTVACYKVNALLLAAIFPQSEAGAPRPRLLALPLSPLVVLLTAIALRSFRLPAGDDTLGYTAFATKQ
jgi:SAM-dependent methyltransferase